MSRSYKKNLILKSGRWLKSKWWGIIRRNWKQELKTNKEDAEFKREYSILNQYGHCDYKSICTGDFNNCWCNSYGYQKCKVK